MARTRAWVYALLALAVVAVYRPSLDNGFVDWDDPDWVTHNPHVSELSWSLVGWAFTHVRQANWVPLTWISHAVDRQLFGLDPRGHHLVNVLLHAASALLLLLVASRLTGRFWPSAAAAALFAFHPLRVESVGWISERKDLLCSVFVLLTLLAYERYARRPGIARYLAVLLAFVLALLSKPMAVTVPFVLLVLDVWPLGRLRWPVARAAVLVEKLPLLVLAAAVSFVAYLAQDGGGAIRTWETIGVGERSANAVVALAAYLGKTLWPAPGTLLPLYTHPHYLPEGLGLGSILGAVAVVAALTAVAVAERRRRPYLLVGWLWYVGMLVPVIGLVQVGVQAFADRYAYLPSVGLFIAGSLLVADAVGAGVAGRRIAAAATLASVAVLAALSWRQQAAWQDATSLWRHTVAGQPESPIAHLNLANVLHGDGRAAEALEHYRQAVALGPDYAPAHAALAVRLGERRRYDESFRHFRIALNRRPDDALTRGSFGNALLQAGRAAEGLSELEAAVAADPEQVVLRNSLAEALVAGGRVGDAVDVHRGTLALAPGSPAAHSNLAVACLRAGLRDEGIRRLREAVRLDPAYRAGHHNLGVALREAGDAEAAERHLEIARRLASQPGE